MVVLPGEGVEALGRDGVETAAIRRLTGRPVPGGPVGVGVAVHDLELGAGVLEGHEAVRAEDDHVGPADGDLENAAGRPDGREGDAERLAAPLDTEDDRLRVDIVAVPLAAAGPAVSREAEPLAGLVVAVRTGVVVDRFGVVALACGLALAAGRLEDDAVVLLAEGRVLEDSRREDRQGGPLERAGDALAERLLPDRKSVV